MMGMTAFRMQSYEFERLAVRHGGSWSTTARRQDKKGRPRTRAKPLTWLGSLRVRRSARVSLARKRCASSRLIPALPKTDALRTAPMNNSDEDFRVRLGRIRHRGGGKSFIDQVLRAAKKAGHGGSYAAGRRGSSRSGRSTFG